MRQTTHQRGVSLIELMTVVAILIIVTSIGASMYGPMLRRAELLNQLKYTRSAFLKAKGNAIEFTAPVRLSIASDGKTLVLRDHDRDGSFADDPSVVMGMSTTVGASSPYTRVAPDPDAADTTLLTWYQEGGFAGDTADPFPERTLILLPNGRVHDKDMVHTGGTFFFKSDDDLYYGAVHITAMGEVKTAFLREGEKGSGDNNGWKWIN